MKALSMGRTVVRQASLQILVRAEIPAPHDIPSRRNKPDTGTLTHT